MHNWTRPIINWPHLSVLSVSVSQVSVVITDFTNHFSVIKKYFKHFRNIIAWYFLQHCFQFPSESNILLLWITKSYFCFARNVCVVTCILNVFGVRVYAYFNDGADASRYEDQQAGLLVKQVEENHDGAETSPEHWKTQHTDTKCLVVKEPKYCCLHYCGSNIAQQHCADG